MRRPSRVAKRLISLALAILLCLSGTALAAEPAEERSASDGKYTEDGFAEEIVSSKAEASEEDVSSAPFESALTTNPSPAPTSEPESFDSFVSDVQTSDAAVFSTSTLLVIGGHDTYMKGYPDAVFKPENPMTRSEAAAMLYSLLAQKPAVSSSQFSDVSLSSWYGTAVNSLAQVGVLKGYADGTFLPDRSITRAEFVAALCKCFTLEEGSADFADVPETHWAYPAIAQIYSAGWITGVGEGMFQPDRSITRAEAVTVMNKALERTGDGFAADRDTQKFSDVPATHWAYLHITEAAAPDSSATSEPTPTPSSNYQVGDQVRVTATSGLRLRNQPNTDCEVLTLLSYGTVVTITALAEDGWLQVQTSAGLVGYVSSDYVEAYSAETPSGASLSASALMLAQYQSARLDASVTRGLSQMSWSSSDSNVAVVSYTVSYGTTEKEGAIVYAKSPGTAVLTFSDPSGTVKQSCTITVTQPEAVRFAYASENIAVAGKNLDLVAVTDTGKSSVSFTVTSDPASNWTVSSYSAESRISSYGLPTTQVRVFKKTVAFSVAGTYTVRATADGSSDYCEFQVVVLSSQDDSSVTSFESRRVSNEGLQIIRNFEGEVPEVEDDAISSGNPTVGCGYVVPVNGKFYNNMTESELWALLVRETNKTYGAAVESFRANNSVKMSQAQFDALTSLTYNCGVGILNTESWYLPNAILNSVAPPSNGTISGDTVSGTWNTTGTLNIRSTSIYAEPSLSSTALGLAERGNTVTVTEYRYFGGNTQQMWYKVQYGNITGWVPGALVKISGSVTRDLKYADVAGLSEQFLTWCHANSVVIPGLLYRRLAECKMFFFANYAEAYHSNTNYKYNTYGFVYPDDCKAYDYRR